MGWQVVTDWVWVYAYVGSTGELGIPCAVPFTGEDLIGTVPEAACFRVILVGATASSADDPDRCPECRYNIAHPEYAATLLPTPPAYADMLSVRLRAGVAPESERKTHLVRKPTSHMMPLIMTALCYEPFKRGEAEILPEFTGMPCEVCQYLYENDSGE